MAFSRVCPGWNQDDSYRVRRNGQVERGVVHTTYPGANCLPGAECQAWNEKPRPQQRIDTGKPNGRNAGEHEGATRGKRLVSLSRIGFRHH